MNLYIRTLGFDNMTSEAEAKFIKTGIRESIKEGFVIRHEKLDRGVIILRLSNSTGLYVYGRYEKNIFKYEYYFPFVVGKALSDNEEMTIERHLDKESYAVICDELKTGVTLIFYLQNVMDYLDYLVRILMRMILILTERTKLVKYQSETKRWHLQDCRLVELLCFR